MFFVSKLSWIFISLFLAGADGPAEGGDRRALLVGCTRYELPSVPELWGPANDIPLWQKTLIEDFGFPEGQVTTLLGWPDDPERRPTIANIARAFEDLIGRAAPGHQVVVVLSGHGAQVPVPADRRFAENPEPDGLDEVFLPADVRSWTPAVSEGRDSRRPVRRLARPAPGRGGPCLDRVRLSRHIPGR